MFKVLTDNHLLLPRHIQERLSDEAGGTVTGRREVAFFLATLTDRGAIDLFAELFVPSDRAMGHHVT